MALFGRQKDAAQSFAGLSALIFNLSLFALPFAAINAWQALQDSNVYGYDITETSKAQTRRALEDAAATLIPDNADRSVYWSSLVQREIDEGDFRSARGLLLSARAMLPQSEAQRLEAQLPTNASDDLRAKTALIFLDDAVRKQYEAGASPLGAAARGAGDLVAGAVTGRADNAAQMAGAITSDFFVLGDLRDIGVQGARWVNGEPVDVFVLTLSGVGVALSAGTAATAGGVSPARAGASVIKAAKRTGKLSAKFSAHVEERLFKAIPPQRLKQEISAAMRDAKGADNGAAIAKAFENSVDPAGYKALTEELTDIKAIADATDTTGAVRMLEHAEDATDLKRLRLDAEAGGDRAVVVAKRADGVKLLKAAKGTLKMTNRLTIDFAALFLALFGFVIAVFATLAQALLREWRHGHPDHDTPDRPSELPA